MRIAIIFLVFATECIAQTELLNPLNWRYNAETKAFVCLAKIQTTSRLIKTIVDDSNINAGSSDIVGINLKSVCDFIPINDTLYVVGESETGRELLFASVVGQNVKKRVILLSKYLPIKNTVISRKVGNKNLLIAIVEANNRISLFDINPDTGDFSKEPLSISLDNDETISSMQVQCPAPDVAITSVTTTSRSKVVTSDITFRTIVVCLKNLKDPIMVIEKPSQGGMALGYEGLDKKSLWFYSRNSLNEAELEIWYIDLKKIKAYQVTDAILGTPKHSDLSYWKALVSFDRGEYLFALYGGFNTFSSIDSSNRSHENVVELPAAEGPILAIGPSKNSINVLQMSNDEIKGALKTAIGNLGVKSITSP